jgi:hypothetical protein
MISEAHIKVWISMAEHYLDTETRAELPWTALACVEAGLSVEEARAIWREEVEPTLGSNLLCVAGEWAGWDEAWLVERLTARRARNARRGWFARRFKLDATELNAAAWASIERCMRALLAVAPEARGALAQEQSLRIRSELS